MVNTSDFVTAAVTHFMQFNVDTKVFVKAASPTDRLQLQLDLNELCRWADEWQMKFNVSKCKVMHTGPSNNNYLYYSINGQTMNEVAEHKDLGSNLQNILRFILRLS